MADDLLEPNPAAVLVRTLEDARRVGAETVRAVTRPGSNPTALKVWSKVFGASGVDLARHLSTLPGLCYEIRVRLAAAQSESLEYVNPALTKIEVLPLLSLDMAWPNYWKQIGDDAVQVLGAVKAEVERADDIKVRISKPGDLAVHLTELRAAVIAAPSEEIDEILRRRILRLLTALISALVDPAVATTSEFAQVAEVFAGRMLNDHTAATKLMATKTGRRVLGVGLALHLVLTPATTLATVAGYEMLRPDAKVEAAVASACAGPQRQLEPGNDPPAVGAGTGN